MSPFCDLPNHLQPTVSQFTGQHTLAPLQESSPAPASLSLRVFAVKLSPTLERPYSRTNGLTHECTSLDVPSCICLNRLPPPHRQVRRHRECCHLPRLFRGRLHDRHHARPDRWHVDTLTRLSGAAFYGIAKRRFESRTTSTEHGALRTTRSATLPIIRCSMPVRPCEPMTMRSASISRA